MSLFALDKWARLFRIISQHGGIINSTLKMWRMDSLKEGKYVGTDCLGNRYYENKNYMIGRSRWVEYHPRFSWNYDASHVSAEWFGWLHYKTDKLPAEDWAKYLLNKSCWVPNWLTLHEENLTGTQYAYYPYSTTRPNVRVWNGLLLHWHLSFRIISIFNIVLLGHLVFQANCFTGKTIPVKRKSLDYIKIIPTSPIGEKLGILRIPGNAAASWCLRQNVIAIAAYGHLMLEKKIPVMIKLSSENKIE